MKSFVDLRITDRAQPPVFGLAMFQLMHDSKITLNTHIDASSTSASNMRLFEATGVGTCLLTDWKDNLLQLFEPDQEVVTYRSPEECIEKAQYLLSHERERQAIAEAGQRRTLRDHMIRNRVEVLHEIIMAAL
jgi:spore maturation protein CgeB